MCLYTQNIHEDKIDKLEEIRKYNICKSCHCYNKSLELIYGKVSGNCDIEDYMECDKI